MSIIEFGYDQETVDKVKFLERLKHDITEIEEMQGIINRFNERDLPKTNVFFEVLRRLSAAIPDYDNLKETYDKEVDIEVENK